MPNAVHEVDYRGFLLKRLAAEGSRARLADHLSRSRSWVSSMLNGARPLKPSLAPVVADFLDLDAAHRAYFQALVDLEEGSSDIAKRQAVSIIRSMSIRGSLEERRQDALYAMKEWYVACVFELARCDGFRADPAWIATTLNPPITTVQATRALALLGRFGLLDADGRVDSSTTMEPLYTPLDVPELGAEAAKSFQRDTMSLALEATDRFFGNERHVGGGCFAVSEERFDEIRERFREAYLQVVAEANQDDGTPNRVYAFTVALFPASEYTDRAHDEEDGPGEADALPPSPVVKTVS